MITDDLSEKLCKAFCSGISVNPVASGYAISSVFEDDSGDRISFYLSPSLDGYRIEDDGSYLAHLVAKDVPINEGTRGQLLDAILSKANAYWDKETYEIKTSSFPESDVAQRVIEFLSSMIRVRDLELLTREVVRSTFREDAVAALSSRLGNLATLEENEPVNRQFSEYPADLVIRPRATVPGMPAAIYFANSNDKLNEALLLQMEAQAKRVSDFKVIALIEEPDLKLISRKKFQRAQNRALSMPIFRGDEEAAVDMIGRSMGLLAA
ncbi:DUF1828 domain-containing protein [Bradyrhizobium diazoefficiens]|uniref:DUF1828 domain-containing protein n=1 Tax=Bradyrhizobium diazoefficiens TaxID=1355477 RepID=UPI00272AD76B|nr:DUF1828 domain-containing protein [Bradyrhizobium diazoefficiens]WLA58520.1 DUF1828 domain-containing protein [Bradyrhizobium diazoefficiens]